MSSGFREFLEEQFAPIGGVTFRSMFGGLGIFRDGTMFALVGDDTLYFRVDDGNQPDFEAEDSEPFTYGGKGLTMSYWRAPERLFDDAEEFVRWANNAIDASRRVAASKKKPARKKR